MPGGAGYPRFPEIVELHAKVVDTREGAGMTVEVRRMTASRYALVKIRRERNPLQPADFGSRPAIVSSATANAELAPATEAATTARTRSDGASITTGRSAEKA